MKVNLVNIKSFVEGNSRLLIDNLGNSFFKLDNHIKEQVAYRASICYESCFEKGFYIQQKNKFRKKSCKSCGCSVPGKWYSNDACSGNTYPDLMDEYTWHIYKQANKIELDFSFLNKANENI